MPVSYFSPIVRSSPALTTVKMVLMTTALQPNTQKAMVEVRVQFTSKPNCFQNRLTYRMVS
jgi:hypothetical protein